MIDNFDDIKTLKEIEQYGGDVYAWARDKSEENEKFIGYKLDENKMARLNRLKDICAELAKRDHDIKVDTTMLTNENRHGGVRLRLPEVYISTHRGTMQLIACLFNEADSVCMSAIGNSGDVVVSFDIMDMWAEWGSTDDKKKKK